MDVMPVTEMLLVLERAREEERARVEWLAQAKRERRAATMALLERFSVGRRVERVTLEDGRLLVLDGKRRQCRIFTVKGRAKLRRNGRALHQR